MNKTFRNSLIAAAAVLACTVGTKAHAATLSSSQAIQLCMAAKESNDMGLSVKPLLEQVFTSKGAPAYLANVAMNEMKAYCPKAY